MLSHRLSNIIFILVLLAVCAYMAVVAEGFEATGLLASSGLPSKFFPQLLLGFIAICALGVLISYFRKDPKLEADPENLYKEPVHALRGLLTLGSVIVGYFIWKYVGYLPMVVFLGTATCLSMGTRSPLVYAIVYALSAGVYLVFTQLLGTQF